MYRKLFSFFFSVTYTSRQAIEIEKRENLEMNTIRTSSLHGKLFFTLWKNQQVIYFVPVRFYANLKPVNFMEYISPSS